MVTATVKRENKSVIINQTDNAAHKSIESKTINLEQEIISNIIKSTTLTPTKPAKTEPTMTATQTTALMNSKHSHKDNDPTAILKKDTFIFSLSLSLLFFIFSFIGFNSFFILFVLSLSGSFAVKRYLPFAAQVLMKSGLAGKDLNKIDKPLR